MVQAAEKTIQRGPWLTISTVHGLLALSFGVAYSFGIFFEKIQQSFDLGSAKTSTIFSVTAFLYYAIGPVSGRAADYMSARKIIAGGVLSLALGLFLTSFAQIYWQVIASFSIFVGLGVGLIYVPAIRALQSSVLRNRARATGLALSGTGVGTFVIPIVADRLLVFMSWQTSLQIMAAGVLFLGFPAVALMPASGFSAGVSSKLSLARLLREPQFWLLFAVIFLASIGTLLSLVHVVPYATHYGFSAHEGALLLGLIGIGNISGRCILPYLGDRFSATRLLGWVTFGLSAALAAWCVATTLPALAAFAIILGMTSGGTIALYPTVTADHFGTDNLGTILGALYFGVGIAALVGPSLAGLSFDLFGDYRPSIALSAMCAFASALLIAVFQRLKTVSTHAIA